jgi:glucan biosynthesis protein C
MPPRAGGASAAVDNLRAVVIVLVLAFHSMLAYLKFLPDHAFTFADATMLWRAFPIVDHQRWIGFDIFCAWLDVYLMSFFLLLSGLFAWPSLMRKGAGAFLADRLLRLGLPFAVVVFLLMPITQYPTYLQTAGDASLANYWQQWRALPIWPSGPMWFLWMLLAGDIALVGVYQFLGRWRPFVLRLSNYGRSHPVRFLAGFLLASALAYVPLALIYGISAWWQVGPFSFQLCRPLHYAVYFLGGVAIGACGIERGLLAAEGSLPRHWLRWLGAAAVLFAAWAGLTGLTLRAGDAAPIGLQIADDLSFVLACFANCGLAFALALRFGAWRWLPLAGLQANAYGMFLVHYLFVVWLQFALLGFTLPAVAKATIVATGTIMLSWGASSALRRVSAIANIMGSDRRRTAVATPASPRVVAGKGLAD